MSHFRQLLNKYVIGLVTTSDLPIVAVSAMRDGYDSPSLSLLAVCGPSDSLWQIETYFKDTLQELDIVLPEPKEAAIAVACCMIEDIIAGRKEIMIVTRKIAYEVLANYNDGNKYVFDKIGFEKIYGLYDTYDDLSQANRRWDKRKTNEELMVEVKNELLTELVRWRELYHK